MSLVVNADFSPVEFKIEDKELDYLATNVVLKRNQILTSFF